MSKYVLTAFLSVFAFAALPSSAEACEQHAAKADEAKGEAGGCDPANCPMAKANGGECPMAKGGECPMAKGEGHEKCAKCEKCDGTKCDASKCDHAKCDPAKCGKEHGKHKKAGAKAGGKAAAQPAKAAAAK